MAKAQPSSLEIRNAILNYGLPRIDPAHWLTKSDPASERSSSTLDLISDSTAEHSEEAWLKPRDSSVEPQELYEQRGCGERRLMQGEKVAHQDMAKPEAIEGAVTLEKWAEDNRSVMTRTQRRHKQRKCAQARLRSEIPDATAGNSNVSNDMRANVAATKMFQ
ncbi:unnamed protein product [Prorocentrum cordatum]|uniref:Uncharacterized protein n=1 Tax=Prorocentrum cordatum TaxID=2364126 RepID=A0ABN9R9W0_9DINO|nr:unnamed protein product [Polarella glacialis]